MNEFEPKDKTFSKETSQIKKVNLKVGGIYPKTNGNNKTIRKYSKKIAPSSTSSGRGRKCSGREVAKESLSSSFMRSWLASSECGPQSLSGSLSDSKLGEAETLSSSEKVQEK